MCWNATVSLQTFVVSFVSLLVLYYIKYDKLILAYTFSFVLMQLLEFFMWVFIKKITALHILSLLSFILIFIQPIIVLYYAKYAYIIKYYLLLQFLLFVVCVFFFDLRLSSFTFSPYVAKNLHLSWNWMHNDIYFAGFCIIYLLFYLGPLYTKHYYWMFGISVFTLLFSIYNYSKYKTVSSMWCWIANLIIMVAIADALIKYVSIE